MTTDLAAPDVDALLKRLPKEPAPVEEGRSQGLLFPTYWTGPLRQLLKDAPQAVEPRSNEFPLTAPGLFVCRADEYLHRTITYCTYCRTKRRFVGRYALWLGTVWTCCGCGGTWDDSGWYRAPQQRAAAVADAAGLWKAAGPHDIEAFAAWCDGQLGIEPLREGLEAGA